MEAGRALGVIDGIAARFDRKALYVFPDRLVLVSSGLGAMMGRTLAMQFGLIGMLIYALGAKSRAAAATARLELSPEQLLAGDPKARQIMIRDIVDAHLTAGFFSAKLQLSLVDGTTPTFTWTKSENPTDQVRGVLRAALGTRLLDSRKAA